MRVIKRYSEAFKRQVVKEYEGGVSCAQLKAKYGIGGSSTVSEWVKKYSHEGLKHKVILVQETAEQDQVKALKAQVRALKEAVAQLSLEKMAAEKTLEVYQEEYGDLLAKKNDQSLSGKSAEQESSR